MTEEPGELQSTGLQRVGHDCVTNTHTCFLCYRTVKSFACVSSLNPSRELCGRHFCYSDSEETGAQEFKKNLPL